MATGSMRVGLAIAAVCASLLGACGSDERSAASGPVKTADPVRTFAPLVRIDGRERWLPMSTDSFLDHSGLEWANGPCQERDVTASGTLPAGVPSDIPRLDPRRLGLSGEPYRVRQTTPSCLGVGRRSYTSVERTRPFDPGERADGLRPGEGFALDVADDFQTGKRPAADGRLSGVPAYYMRQRTTGGGRAIVRLRYWLLFGRDGSAREGDWEWVDVLASHARRRDSYKPVAVVLSRPGGSLRVPWSEIALGGRRATHPIVRLSRGVHTPQPKSDCDDCVEWATWQSLRAAHMEPWWGYAGAWGAAGDSDRTTGPTGPIPRDTVRADRK